MCDGLLIHHQCTILISSAVMIIIIIIIIMANRACEWCPEEPGCGGRQETCTES